jgi:hypothetical protein
MVHKFDPIIIDEQILRGIREVVLRRTIHRIKAADKRGHHDFSDHVSPHNTSEIDYLGPPVRS